MSSYKDGIRKARKAVIEALDELAKIDGPSPIEPISRAKIEGHTALVNAKHHFDKALGE